MVFVCVQYTHTHTQRERERERERDRIKPDLKAQVQILDQEFFHLIVECTERAMSRSKHFG